MNRKQLGKIMAVGVVSVSAFMAVPGAAYAGQWQQNHGRWQYQEEDGSFIRGGMNKINGENYYFDDTGNMVTGWVDDGGSWYYFNPGGERLSGWLNQGGTWYYLRSNGVMMTEGWRTIENSQYYFYENGAMAANSFIGKYYVDENGMRNTDFNIRKAKKGETPTEEDYEKAAEELNQIPKVVLSQYIKEGWKFVIDSEKKTRNQTEIDEITYPVNLYKNATDKEILFDEADGIAFTMLREFVSQKGIVQEYFPRLLAAWTFDSVNEDELEGSPASYYSNLSYHLSDQIMLYLSPDTRGEVREMNESLYQIIEEITGKYGLSL